MASLEIQKALNDYESYIRNHGICKEVLDAYYQATFWAKEKDNDIDTALEISSRAKDIINKYVIKGTDGGDIWKLEKYCLDNKTQHETVNQYYELLKMEAPYRFESFIFYMEKNRIQSKRFYLPRKKTLSIVVADLQDLEVGRVGKNIFLKREIAQRKLRNNEKQIFEKIPDERIKEIGENETRKIELTSL